MSVSHVASYSPGPWVAASQDGAWLLADLGLDDSRLSACWTALDGDHPEEVLDVLLGEGLAGLPGFALVVARVATTRVVVRHPATVTCHRGGADPTVVSGAVGQTWADVELPGEYDTITIAAGDNEPGTVRLPLARGITPAGFLALDATAAPKPLADIDDARADAAPPASPELAEPPELLGLPEQPPSMIGADDAAGDVDDVAKPVAVAPGRVVPDESADEIVDEITDPAVEPRGGSSYYGRLLGATVDRDALLAELAELDEQDTPPEGAGDPGEPHVASGHTAIWQPDAGVGAEPPEKPQGLAESGRLADPPAPADVRLPAPPSQPASSPASAGDLIDGVPWATGSTAASSAPPPAPAPVTAPATPPVPSPPPPASPAAAAPLPIPAATPTAPPTGKETEVLTVNRAELLRSMAAPPPSGPTVLAVRCPQAHLTPAYSPQCRVCGADIGDQVPTEEPRPPLGRLVLSTGEVVILDRDVVLGRAPESTEQDPALRPNLVRLTDSGEVSRMHVRITLDGWQPLLRDLGSSNGTTLTLSASSPQQLRPQEDYVLEPGCEVSLADVVSFRFDVAE